MVNNAIHFNIISNQQKIQCTGGQSLSSRNSCSLLQGRFIANSLTKSPMPILNHNPISPKRTVPDTPYQQNKLFISHKKRLLPLKKLPMCSGARPCLLLSPWGPAQPQPGGETRQKLAHKMGFSALA